MPKSRKSTLRRLIGLEHFPQPPLIRTRYPVVLMHGFGVLAGIRRGGHLHEEAMHLRQYAVQAYAPNVAPYNTVTVRAQMWRERLALILEETGANRLNLIAHSMGGLDARYLIHKNRGHEVVVSLVTVATPHHGTALAEIMLDQPKRMRKWAADLAKWMSHNTHEDATADLLQALAELTPEYVCETLNSAIPNHPAVAYFSYAARAGKGTDTRINPLLRVYNALLYEREGVNDGFVSVESAKWGKVLGILDADHAQEVGTHGIYNNTFDSNNFYRSIVEMLARQGF